VILRICAALLVVLTLSCRKDSFRSGVLLVWVPGGGAKQERIQALVAELGIPATFLSDREAVSISPRDLASVQTVVCFDGPGGRALSSTAIPGLLRRKANLVLVGESAGILGPGLGFQVVSSNETGFRWADSVRPRLTPGSFDPTSGQALVYGYGDKQVPGWRLTGNAGLPWASDQLGRPRWTERDLPAGGILVAVAVPLAQFAVEGDSLPARILLERAAELTRSPRLWPTPRGRGAMVVNIHIDGQSALPYLPILVRDWPSKVKGTFHITAGPDCDRSGDGKGFSAQDSRMGGPWVARLNALGEVGSHGGWIHNLWAEEAGRWPWTRREEMLRLNADALAPAGPLRSYSSPSGFTPTDVYPWLESRGFTAYYTTGEAGGAPTRAWERGAPCSRSMWAFPFVSLGAAAATYEFKQGGITQAEVSRWLDTLLAFCESRKEGRLVYGHAIDLGDMPQAYFGFLRALASRSADGAVVSLTMRDYASFLERRSRVTWNLETGGNRSILKATGPSLRDLSFRIPGEWRFSAAPGLTFQVLAEETWVTVNDDRTGLEVALWR
jgi:nicotinamidase-related amidase